MGIYQLLLGKRDFNFKVIALLTLLTLCVVWPVGAVTTEEQIAALKAERNEAVFSVQHIVNQPVTHLKRTPDMNARLFSPGWFHDGVVTPRFDAVDIRITQEFPYAGRQYVTSDLNPGEAFLGDELEFNSMTKFFYTTRNVPKKKLTEAEMLEINRLYRIIGHCNQQLEELQNPAPPLLKFQQWALAHKPVVAAIIGALMVALVFLRGRKSRGQEMEN